MLKRKLEHTESRSHSSWHSGFPGESNSSPMTFGPRVDHEGLGFSTPDMRDQMGYGLHRQVASGASTGFGIKPEEMMARMALEVQGKDGWGVGWGSAPREGWFMPRTSPPPPLPLPPVPRGYPVEETTSVQSMRQFAEVARAGGSGGAEGFCTPRGGVGSSRFDSQGYPVSPGGTTIRPPPIPPPMSPRDSAGHLQVSSVPPEPRMDFARASPGIYEGPGHLGGLSRPEEPAKYIMELPKLAQVDLSSSAVTCGNWLAQVRQIFQGLSPSADVWFQAVELAANQGYARWLVADPLGRLAIDPGSVVASFDHQKFQRVESRAVTLLLASMPSSFKDDLVMNRWLSSASILFRVMCIWQPGGSSERAHLLAQLVQPEGCKSYREALPILRKWHQNLQRAREIQATLPDPSLLLKGIDQATSVVLGASPMIAFRVNAFRHASVLDYNPSVQGVAQLVRLIQSECESAAISSESNSERRAKAASLQGAKEPPPSKSPPPPPPVPVPMVSQVGVGEAKGKGKGKEKGGEGNQPLCYKYGDASGCRFGDGCMFRHDKAKARKEGRCLLCGQEGHFKLECKIAPQEGRPTAAEAKAEGLPKSGSSELAKGSPKGKAKAKASVQTKGVVEDGNSRNQVGASAASGTSPGGGLTHEALVAEAAKLLKGVSLRAARVDDLDVSWIRSALSSASDPEYCLIDSGATNALRPASAAELHGCRIIHVDLASGGTDLRINSHGTLLHAGHCQVILPANYLVELGYSITWRRRGCKVRHPKQGALDVVVVKGCPLIPKEVGLRLLQEYEARRQGLPVLSKAEIENLGKGLSKDQARGWLGKRVQDVGESGVTEVDQFVFLRALFPELPLRLIAQACAPVLDQQGTDWSELPWNRRWRRSVSKALPGSVLIAVSPFPTSWKGLGRVIQLADSDKGLGSKVVFQLMMSWASRGLIGGVVKGAVGHAEAGESGIETEVGLLRRVWGDGEVEELGGDRERAVRFLRLLLVFSVAQASRDAKGGITGAWTPDDEVSDRFQGTEAQKVLQESDSPVELAQWALRKAAANLRNERRRKALRRSEVFLVLDPGEGSNTEEGPLDGLVEAYGLHWAGFDLGCFGAPGVYPSRVVTSSWFLFEILEEVRAKGEGRRALEVIQASFPEGLGLGRCGWTGHVLRLIQGAWLEWEGEVSRSGEVEERQLLLKKLSEAESYARHVEQDHVPFRKGCPTCIMSQGRRRAHWRTSHPSVHSLSVDLAGPFISGRSYDEEASGRDRHEGYKFFLACAYTVPQSFDPKGNLPEDCSEYVLSDEEWVPVPSQDVAEEEAQQELDAIFDFPAGNSVKVVERRFRDKGPEPPGPNELAPGADPLRKSKGSQPEDEERVLKYRTLFLGVPLRSKAGKGATLAVQSVVNKLEALGLPVHRYHSDRAKELRTTVLLSWMKQQGIHVTSTPGEAPSGNRAELAVQNLKGFVRKLLHASKLDKSLWPLALLHATARNWAVFMESLGIPQPHLLPFGTKVHARCRSRSGYDSQWGARTAEGIFVGPAPNVSGGYLVLLPQGEEGDGAKVLLTSTIFPLRGEPSGVPRKPKFRLTGKRSPDFVVRAVAATLFEKEPGAETAHTPGGESFGVNFEFSDVPDEEASDEGLVELGDLREVLGLDKEDWDSVDCFFSPDLEGSEFEIKGVSATGNDVEAWIRDCLDRGEFTATECCEVLRRSFRELPVAKRSLLQRQGRAVVCGLFAVGGFKGVSNWARRFPLMTEYVNRFLRKGNPEGCWTTVYLSHNTKMPLHRDLRNSREFPIIARAVGDFVGGGLWLESDREQSVSCRQLPDGSVRPGVVHNLRTASVVFSGDQWHASEEWQGDRWVLSAFVPRL